MQRAYAGATVLTSPTYHVVHIGNVPKFFDEIRNEFDLKQACIAYARGGVGAGTDSSRRHAHVLVQDFVVTSDETQTRQAFKIRSSKVKSGENLEIYAEQLFRSNVRKNSSGAGDAATLCISMEDTAFVVCADVEQVRRPR
jgi:hypothetical protein